jgi:Clp amino terminal domain, pathogenicity island component
VFLVPELENDSSTWIDKRPGRVSSRTVPDASIDLLREALRLERPCDALTALSRLRGRLEELERLLVRNARAEGVSWGALGELLGVSKQAIHKRHAADDAPPAIGVEAVPAVANVAIRADARSVVRLAREEARARGHYPVGTGHLLLGLMRQGGAAAEALVAASLTLDAARGRVDGLVAALPAQAGADDGQPVSRAARRALEQSLHEAIGRSDRHLGPEHLLLALLGEERGVARHVLGTLGIDVSAVEQGLERALAKAGTSDPVPNLAA